MTDLGEEFTPVWNDLRLNIPAVNNALDGLVTGQFKVAPLFECETDLFSALRDEAMTLIGASPGQILGQGHPTALYVQANDPTWDMKAASIHQYSLYNSHNDLLFNDEDHHWHTSHRRFNSKLPTLPKFFSKYFGHSELQNFRMQAIEGTGSLGRHREKIIGIPKRERHFKLRFHLPIVTNTNVQFELDNQSFSMNAGTVYLFNQSCMHSVVNDGAELRVHLIFDCYLNAYILEKIIAPACQHLLQ